MHTCSRHDQSNNVHTTGVGAQVGAHPHPSSQCLGWQRFSVYLQLCCHHHYLGSTLPTLPTKAVVVALSIAVAHLTFQAASVQALLIPVQPCQVAQPRLGSAAALEELLQRPSALLQLV